MIKKQQKYKEAKVKPYNGHPLYSMAYEEWFDNINAYLEYMDDHVEESDDLELKESWIAAQQTTKGICDHGQLYLSEPNYLPTLSFDEEIELPDNCDDLSDILKPDHPISLKLDELNRLIEETKFIVSFSETSFKPDPDTF